LALHQPRFLFVKTLRRPYIPDDIPVPKRQRRMPIVLSVEEVERLIASARNLMHRTMLMMLYATGLRRAELSHLKVSDIDGERMVIHVRQGKGGRDRDVLLSPKLLETLREYWRWMKPQTYLFPGTVKNWRADVPITEKIIWTATAEAAKRLALRSMSLLIHSGTALPPTCWKPEPIYALSRYCSDIPSWTTQPSIFICPVAICRRFPVPWKRSKFPAPKR
jgi:integrase